MDCSLSALNLHSQTPQHTSFLGSFEVCCWVCFSCLYSMVDTIAHSHGGRSRRVTEAATAYGRTILWEGTFICKVRW